MDGLVVMYTRADGGLSIVHGVPKAVIEKDLGREFSDQEYEQWVTSRSIPPTGSNVTKITLEDIPSDNEFRDAWKHDSGKIGFDLDKAKTIQLERIRQAREPKLLELDKQFMLALEKGEDTKTIVAEKQRLRDITEPLKALVPTNIDDIKNAYPGELRA